MAYSITRVERKEDKVFINLEVNDELGIYNFGKWLTSEEVGSYNEDESSINTIADNYIVAAHAQQYLMLNPVVQEDIVEEE